MVRVSSGGEFWAAVEAASKTTARKRATEYRFTPVRSGAAGCVARGSAGDAHKCRGGFAHQDAHFGMARLQRRFETAGAQGFAAIGSNGGDEGSPQGIGRALTVALVGRKVEKVFDLDAGGDERDLDVAGQKLV